MSEPQTGQGDPDNQVGQRDPAQTEQPAPGPDSTKTGEERTNQEPGPDDTGGEKSNEGEGEQKPAEKAE